AQGRRRITLEELDAGFTGVALLFEPEENFQRQKKQDGIVSAVIRRLEGQSKVLACLMILGLAMVIPSIILPMYTRIFIDDILGLGNDNWVIILIIGMIATVTFKACFTYYQKYLFIIFEKKIALLTTHKLVYHLFRLPMSFFDQRMAGDLADRTTNNDQICTFVIGELIQNAINVVLSILYFGLLYAYSPLLSLIGLGSMMMNIIIAKVSANYMARTIMKVQQDEGKMYGVMLSGIRMITTLKAAGVEHDYASRVLGNYAKSITRKQEHGKLMQIINSIPEITTQLSNVLVLLVGGVLVMNGEMTSGMLIAFVTILGLFTEPTNQLIEFAQKIQQARADMNRVDDILKYEEDKIYDHDVEQELGTEKLSGHMELDHISFGYGILDKPLIQDFSFRLECGKSIAFVGASGSGKSTVSKLISGLYLPWSGEIRVDGKPIGEVQPEILRSSIATVSQEISLFAGTIRENITMWDTTIRDEDMIQAAKDACIHDAITLKVGAYDAILTEGGANLSGGQRQRLEIARSLVNNPTILVMDEATSALDAVTEKQIVDNLKRRGCTCIVVAHRLSTIRDSDAIIVLANGRIVQSGTHDQLAQIPGHYQDLLKTI
ncbi:MAG: ATP-binding cassette domain-containing protein, partial [Eubacteriales bacterium]